MKSLAIQIYEEPGIPAEVKEALENIKNTMRLQSKKGNKEADFILRHL